MSLVLAMVATTILGQAYPPTHLLMQEDTLKTVFAGLAVLVSIVALGVSTSAYEKTAELSKRIADRTVTIEAQKLLLEINKVLVSDPRLFALYDGKDDKLRKLIDDLKAELQKKEAPAEAAGDLAGKLTAVGLMVLNVFEIVFAQMPEGKEFETWKEYFKDTLTKCSTVPNLLALPEAKKIYHPKLIDAYKKWKDPVANSA